MYKISCIFSGGDCPFSIEIDETQTVFDLQKAIKLEQPDLATVLPRKLELYRINLAESDKDFKKKLECKLKDLSKVPRLYASCQLSQYFGSSNPPKGGKVHILIQIVPPQMSYYIEEPCTRETLERLKYPELRKKAKEIGVMANACMVPQILEAMQNLRLTADGEALLPPPTQQHNLAGQTTSTPDGYKGQTIMEKISSIYEAIRSLKQVDFADPDLFGGLPFPSPHPLPGSRRFSSHNGDATTFVYMGREVFNELHKSIHQDDIQQGSNKLYLYGPSGTGKSHLLAALVCQLVLNGERVFYIPDCRRLVMGDALWCIQTALLFAFHDDSDLCTTIRAASLAALCGLAQTQDPRSFYVVIDQFNALEIMGPTDCNSERKREMLNWLQTFGGTQKVIFSASANEQSSQNADLKQSNIRTFYLQSGMNKVEMTKWWDRNWTRLPALDHDTRMWVEDITGRIPIYLRALLEFKGENFDRENFLRCPELAGVATDITLFYRKLLVSASPGIKEECLRIMEAILMTRHYTAHKSWYDLRYFYFNDKVGYSTCGIAFSTLLAEYRQLKVTLNYKLDEWYEAISLSPNHTILGYLVEQMCLNAIQRGALGGTILQEIDKELGNRLEEKEFFHDIPPVADMIDRQIDLQLYIPNTVNFPDIDGAIVRLDHVKREAFVYLFQVAIAKAHKDSETNFYMKQWEQWKKRFTTHKYSVSSTFVWIEEKPSTTNGLKKIEGTNRDTRTGQKVVVDGHGSVCISIKSLDPVLHAYYGST